MEQTMVTSEDITRISKCMGSYVHLDDVDIPAIWNICRDGVDNFAPDIVGISGIATETFQLYGDRRAFEINRRVVQALRAMIYSYADPGEELEPPDSFSDNDYDRWISENDQLVSLYQIMGYEFLPDEEYDAPQVYQRSDGSFYTWMGDVKYNLVETGETRPMASPR